MTLHEFLRSFLSALSLHKVEYCILRNYEGLPYNNPANDIDFLIAEDSLNVIQDILVSLPNLKVTGYIERAYVASFFLHGICWGNGLTGLQVDFIFRLDWKGQPYISVNGVLASSRALPDMPWLRIPDKANEAFISLHQSYLLGGFIKERYKKQISDTCRSVKKTMLELHSNAFGTPLGEKLVHFLAAEEFGSVINLIGAVRKSLLFRKLRQNPVQAATGIVRHYLYEVYVRYAPVYLDTVTIFGPDGSGKSSVLGHVKERLTNTTKAIQVLHLKPQLSFRHRSQTIGPVTDPHARSKRSALVSTLKLLTWLAEYWLFYFFASRPNLTLRIFDRYYHDIFIDPQRYRYGGPMWLAQWVGKIVPKPDLFILLDAPPEVLQARKQEVPLDESARQREAYLSLVRGMKNGVVVDASGALDDVVVEVSRVILNFMAERTRKRLGQPADC
jgi:thymidylate kinase